MSPDLRTGSPVLGAEDVRIIEEKLLPEYLPRQRWFGSKSRRIASTRIVDWGVIDHGHAALVLVNIVYEAGEPDTYLVVLGMSFGDAAEELRESPPPTAILAPVHSPQEEGVLRDGLCSESTAGRAAGG